MELTDDLVAIQGILINVIKTTGEFTKINYKGGNEEKILKIVEEIQKHIISKNYIKDGKINSSYDKQVEDIVVFLAINTKYKTPLELEDYGHLIDIMPQLSKCVLVNVVYGLDLCKYYCKVIEKLPLKHGVELLEEIVSRLKKSIPEIQLRYAIMFLRGAAMKLSSSEITEKDEDDVYKLLEITNIILQFLTGVHPGHMKNYKLVQLYQHMGYTLLSLFELLLYCNKENLNMKNFINSVLETCCAVIKNVTINVFCSWAEIEIGDEPLQSLIAEKAYEVVEEYQKYTEAKELLGMLGTMAKKPKTLSERIHAADVTTIIKKIYVSDQDQKAWFQALLATKVFDSKDTMKCVSTWAHLCDSYDVTRLLNQCHSSNNKEAKRLTIKCASVLTSDELITVMTRYFYENKFKPLVSDAGEVDSQLKLIFNKMSGQTNIDDNFIIDMGLLMLQEPNVVLKSVYNECLRNKCYIPCYERFFSSIKEIVNINNFGIDTLQQVVLSSGKLDVNNIDNYVSLFTTLLEINYLTSNQIINNLILPWLCRLRSENGFEQLGCVLQILLACSIQIPATPEMTDVRWSLLNTVNDCRCTFLELNIVKQQTASYAVDVINSLCEINRNYNFEEEFHTPADTTKPCDEFTNYYKKYLSCKTGITLLGMFCEDFNIENYTECVSRVLRFLPRAVTNEWSIILEDIFLLCGSEKAMELLTDVMILLCKVVQTQDPSTNTGKQVIVALKYCLQEYGIALQNFQSGTTVEVEVIIAKNICRLLKHLPEVLMQEEGLSITSILTERSLKSLNKDRDFVCSLISINNNLICRTIAQRMSN